MNKFRLLTTLFVLACSLNFSIEAQNPADQVAELDSTINQQIDDIIKKSYKYNEEGKSYRVVETSRLTKLESSVNKAIDQLESDIAASAKTIEDQQNTITKLQGELESTGSKLESVTVEKNNMSLFGVIPMKKGAYRTIMWAIIFALIALLFFFIVSFLRSNVVTRQTKAKLEKTREEFEAYRKKSMEDELVLRRKLQTEINKNAG